MAHRPRTVWLISSYALAIVIAGAHSVARAAQARSATFPEPVLQIGQTSAIWSVDVTPSGRYLVATSGHDVAIWHREKGWLLRTLTGHRSEVQAVALSPDGTLVASGTDDGELALWRMDDGRRIWNKTQANSHIAAVRFTQDGSIMTASWDNTIRLWNEAGCAASCVIAKTTGSPASLALSPDERWIATGDTSNRVSVWRLAADRLSASPHQSLTLSGGDRSHVRGISIDRQGRLIAVNFAGQVVYQQLEPWSTLWTKETGLRLDGAAITPDGLRVCVVGNEALWVGRAICFRSQDGERVPLNELFAGGVQFPSNAFRSMVITRDGRWLIGAGIYLVQLDLVGESPSTLIAPSASVTPPLNISISGDASSILWPLNGLHRFSLLSGHFVPTPPEAGEERIRPVFRSPPTLSVDGRFIALEGVRVRIGSDGRATDVRPPSTGAEINIGVLLLNAEDNRMVAELDVVTEDAVPTFAADGSVLLWRSRRGISVVDLPCVCNRRDIAVALDSLVYVDLAVDPHGDWVAVPIDRGVVGVYSLSSGALTHRLDSLQGATIRRLAFVPSSADTLSVAIGTDEGDLYVWNESRLAHVALSRSPVTALDVARDASQIVVGKENGDLAVINVATGVLAYYLPAAHAGMISAVRFGYGPWICSAGWDGTFRFWNRKTAERVGTLAFSLQGGSLSWTFVSRQGHFEGEPRAFASILWRFSERLDDVMPVEAFTRDFYRYGVLREVLESARIPPAPKVLNAVDRRVASLSLDTEPDGREIVETRTVKARIRITHLRDRANEFRDVKLFRDGVLVKQWHGVIPKSTTELSVDVPIVGGLNELQAYGFNGDRVKSLDATNGVVGGRALDRPGTVYVLSVGVDSYDQSIGSLRYSENDARAFNRAIQASQSARAFRSAVLVDRDATRENILCALKRLGATGTPPTCRVEQLSKLMPITPFDSVFVFFSGHGVSSTKEFALLPADAIAGRPRADGRRSVANGLTAQDLESAFELITARQIFLVIDACGAGELLPRDRSVPAPLNLGGFAQLAREKGMFVLAAATKRSAAMEGPPAGPGGERSILSYVLVQEGLLEGRADTRVHDGQIDVEEWFSYAARHVPSVAQQQPIYFMPLQHTDNPASMVGRVPH